MKSEDLLQRIPTTVFDEELNDPPEELLVENELVSSDFENSYDSNHFGSLSPMSSPGAYDFRDDLSSTSKVYTNLEPATKQAKRMEENNNILTYMSTKAYPAIPENSENIDRLRTVPPSEWTSHDVINFIYFIADTHQFSFEKLRLEAFQNVSGKELFSMTKEDLIKRDRQYGGDIFEVVNQMTQNGALLRSAVDYLHQLPKSAHIKQENLYDGYLSGDSQHGYNCLGSQQRNIGGLPSFHVFSHSTRSECQGQYLESDIINNIPQLNTCGVKYEVDFYKYDYDSDPALCSIPPLSELNNRHYSTSNSLDSEGESTGSSPNSYGSSFTNDSHFSYEDNYPFYHENLNTKEKKCQRTQEPKPKGSGGNRGRKPGGKGNHLWEFIRDLLLEPKYNPKVIKWENKREGIFKIVQSGAVARLWGRKKNNGGMNYEKLSRALRFSRTAGYFDEVPRTGEYPKKLCFKFGAKAKW